MGKEGDRQRESVISQDLFRSTHRVHCLLLLLLMLLLLFVCRDVLDELMTINLVMFISISRVVLLSQIFGLLTFNKATH